MLDTGDLLSVDAVPGGTTLLCVGPPMAGKRRLALRLLGRAADGDPVVLISTDSSAGAVRREFVHAADGTPAVGVVDCTAEAHADDSTDDRTRRVSAPTDLGQVGAATTDLLDALDSGRGDALPRVGLLSLTTLSLNAAVPDVVRFVHALARTVADRVGVAVLTAHAETFDRETVQRVRSIVDGTVFVREAPDGVEVRSEGIGAGDDWHAVALSPAVREDLGVPEPSTPARATGPSVRDAGRGFDSLADLIDQVESDRPTLTVLNRETPDDRFAAIEGFFADLDVAVRETTLGTDTPRDVALLHRGPSQLASSPVSELAAGVATARARTDPFEDRRGPDVLEALDERVFGARGVDRQFLVDASTAIEMTAWQTGGGHLLAGFQQLSRYWESARSRRVMHRIARAGVEVDIYGAPDVLPDPDLANVRVHADSAPEIRDSWFVVFDGDGHTDRTGALVVRETDPDVYHGFWTHDPALSTDVFQYLRETYGGADEDPQQAPS